MSNCPQCSKEIKEPICRLVRDSCGHQKCRVCLVADVETCKQCAESDRKPKSPENESLDNESLENRLSENKSSETKSSETKSSENSLETDTSVIKYEKSPKTTERKSASRQYNRPIILPNHIIYADDVYTCKICEKQFKTKGHIKYHQYCGGGIKKPFNCLLCSKEFASRSHLKVHLSSHENKKPHVCKKCGKSFVTKSKLKRHSVMHTGNKAYKCPTCDKSFVSKDKLKVHNFIHSKEKPFACKQCKARFNNSSNLKKHLAVHLKEGVHVCDQCDKKFKLKATLMLHYRVHSNYKGYKCQDCVKAFFNLKDLQRHALVHSDEKRYNCDECKTYFRRKDNLRRHIKNFHPDKKPTITEKTPKPTKPRIVDTPNAINVITSSSSLIKKESVKAPVVNGPIKLAFKTSAFKNTYNIQRNIEPEDNVNIYEKILLPNNVVPKEPKQAENGDVYKAFKFKLTNTDRQMDAEEQFDRTVESSGKIYTELRTVSENCASVIVTANNQSEMYRNYV